MSQQRARLAPLPGPSPYGAFVAASLLVFLVAMAFAVALPRRAPPRLAPSLAAPDLIIPVDGVAADALVDTWGAARSEGRKHEGIDIMSRAGTPVRAAAAGRIAKLFHSKRGGTTIYQFDRAGHLIFYYAHLRAYAAGLQEGESVEQGQLIAYVGATGNATTPHLHFEIQRAGAKGQWWRGVAVNPYVALKAARLP